MVHIDANMWALLELQVQLLHWLGSRSIVSSLRIVVSPFRDSLLHWYLLQAPVVAVWLASRNELTITIISARNRSSKEP